MLFRSRPVKGEKPKYGRQLKKVSKHIGSLVDALPDPAASAEGTPAYDEKAVDHALSQLPCLFVNKPRLEDKKERELLAAIRAQAKDLAAEGKVHYDQCLRALQPHAEAFLSPAPGSKDAPKWPESDCNRLSKLMVVLLWAHMRDKHVPVEKAHEEVGKGFNPAKATRTALARVIYWELKGRVDSRTDEPFKTAEQDSPLSHDPASPQLQDVMRQVVFVDPEKPPAAWDDNIMLCVIAGNVLENALDLAVFRNQLRVVGIPLDAWLLEREEHLFNCAGRETFEPWLTPGFLEETVKSMWRLSGSMFGATEITYETLAADLREPDVDRVKRAVRRIGIASRTRDERGAAQYAIRFSHGTWRWQPEETEEVNAIGKALMTREQVREIVSKLTPPTEDVEPR